MSISDLDLSKPSDEELAKQLRDLQKQVHIVANQLNERGYNVYGRIDGYKYSYERDNRYNPTYDYSIIITKTVIKTQSL